MESDGEDPHFAFMDGFEQQMDSFWKNEKSGIPPDEIANYFDEESENEDGGIEGLDELTNEEVDKIMEEDEEAALMAEEVARIQAAEQEKIPEKIILDRLNVDQLINMVSRVKLAWPEDLPGYDETEFSTDPQRAKYRESFYHNTDKEKTALWYAENFRRQFQEQFPKRRALVIAPQNECGCQKIFSTFLNPCILGYPEFLDAQTCSAYLKEFFAPQIMEHPTKYPHRIKSHFTVLKTRKANCFEFAICMASFLIGVGYDAYVVDGYASKAVVFNDATEDYIEPPEVPEDGVVTIMAPKKEPPKAAADENKSKLDFLSDLFKAEEEEVEEERPTSPSKYRFKKTLEAGLQPGEVEEEAAAPPEVDQHGDAEQEEAEENMSMELRTEDDEQTETEEEATEEDTEMEEETVHRRKRPEWPDCPEKYYGMRTHAWVLVKAGTREVETSYFIEPFSGNKMAIEDENFFGIETIFNHKNFWVNLQDPSDIFAEELSYDLDDASKWGKLLVEPEKKKKGKEEESNSLFQDDEDETPKKMELLFDMPVSWTPDPIIPQEDYERKYPGGKKTFNYNNAIVELAAPYVNDDGLVKKVLKFAGTSRSPEDLEYIEEKFQNRKDKLARRKWIREGRMLHEYFEKGRKDALKEHVHISGKNKPNYPRDLYYYANAHPQCVSHRRIVKKGMVEHFEERDDLLYYRFTSYGSALCDTSKNTGEEPLSTSKARGFLEMLKGNTPGNKQRVRRKVNTIVEKYRRDESKVVEEDIAEKHMLISEGRLRILFHYGLGNVTRQSLEFFKPKGRNVDTADFHPEDCIEYLADPHAEPTDVFRKFKLLQRLEADQRVSSVLAAQAEEEVYDTVTSRVQQDFKHEIEPDAFAGERNEEYIRMKEQNVVDDDEDGEEDLGDVDFATPFFEKFGWPRNKMEEVLLKKRIMLNAKVRLIKKAHGIKDSYEREAMHLSEKIKWYDRHLDKMTPGQEEEFNHMYNERLFEMHIMERRLTRHQERASEKYYNILLKVLKHPQLNKYSNKKIPPPIPPEPEMSEEEKARLAALAAKLKDCCQFYTVKYVEPKKQNERGIKRHQGEGDNTTSAVAVVGGSPSATVAQPQNPAAVQNPAPPLVTSK